MKTRITASEARKIAENSISSRDEDTLNNIEDCITINISKGNTKCYYCKSMSEIVLKNLVDRGFFIDNLSSQKEGICYLIKW